MRVNSTSTVALCALVVIVASAASVSAHRRDELLQAARIDVARHAVSIELDLTPGIDVAESIVAAIDGDRDGALSSHEQAAYTNRVMGALDVSIDDASPLSLRLVSSTFPDVSAMRRGEGMIRLRISATPPATTRTAGRHQLFFRNTHAAAQSVYLANALVPEDDRVSVTAQRRDGDQSELTIDYAVRDALTWWGRTMTMQRVIPGVMVVVLALAATMATRFRRPVTM